MDGTDEKNTRNLIENNQKSAINPPWQKHWQKV
jgi:hypothetical protein